MRYLAIALAALLIGCATAPKPKDSTMAEKPPAKEQKADVNTADIFTFIIGVFN